MNTMELRVEINVGEHLRAWELEAVRLLLAVPGVRVTGWRESARGETLRSGWSQRFFRRWEQQVGASGLLAAVPDGLSALRLERIAQGSGLPVDVTLLLGGARSTASSVGRAWGFRHADGTPAHAVLPMLREWVQGLAHGRFQFIDAADDAALSEMCLPVDGDADECAERAVMTAMRWPADMARAWIARGAAPQGQKPAACKPIAIPGILDVLRARMRGRPLTAGESDGASQGAWNIGVLHQPIHALLDAGGSRNVRWLPNPSKGMARLEPFGYQDSDRELNVLYRKCGEDGTDARIARVRPKPDNILKRSRAMLDTVPDAGYPYTIQHQGGTHAVINDAGEDRVVLMKVSDANDALVEPVVLLNMALHAPSLFEHGGRWWLMGTSDPAPNAMLRAFHAQHAEGPYTEHACSPLKCDARHARPAGTPFVHVGQLYRPALDASDPDHPAVWINRIDQLDPQIFLETPVRRIDGFAATAYGRGVRTISAMGDVTLVDGLRSPVLSGSRANAKRGRSKHRSKQRTGEDEDDE